MTDPPYPIVDSAVGVNLRWYLANSVFRKASDKGDPEKVVFLSLHMDALHSSMRGLMVYIPSAALRRGSYGKSGAVYASRREYKEQPRVNFSQKELAKSEGLSRQLASSMISAFQSSDLAVHKNKPVRDRIVRRRGRSWVPAVLRYNQTPVQALLELANLENPEDRAAIQKAAFRQRLAEAIVQGLLEYYGDPQPTDGVVTAQAAP